MDLQQYTLKGIDMLETTLDNGNLGVQVEIVLKRKISGIVLTTYFPTILMNVINQATMYMECDHFFEAILTTNITCMTVLASLFILFSSVVPQPTLTLVDIWFLFSLIYPFLLILLHIFIQQSRKNEGVFNKVEAFIKPKEIDKQQMEMSKSKAKNQSTNFLKSELGLILGKIVLPIFGLTFGVLYFLIGCLMF